MRTGQVLCPKTDNLFVWRGRAQKATGEDLPARLSEVLGEEGVEDGVDARVAVRQTVSDDAEGKGRVVQREGAKLHPHGDDVVRQPAEGEGSDQQKNCLSRLQSQNAGGMRRNSSRRNVKLQQNLTDLHTGGGLNGSLRDLHKFKQKTFSLSFCQKLNLNKREEKLNPSDLVKKIKDVAWFSCFLVLLHL